MKKKIKYIFLNIVIVIIWQILSNILFNKFLESNTKIIYYFIVLFPVISFSIYLWILRTKFKNKQYIGKALSLSQHSVKNYSALVRMYIKKYPKDIDRAMMRSVGSPNLTKGIEWGEILFNFLLNEGLKENMSLFDFGCGSGRLALALKKNNFKCNYSGQDIVPELTNYLKLKVPNANVICTEERKILMPDESQDIVVNFSVFTHLLLEEIFIYMKDIFRVLKPGGSHIFSYHEFDLNPFPKEPIKVYIRNLNLENDIVILRYLASYRDLLESFGNDIEKAREHAKTYGIKENRKIIFSIEKFKERYIHLNELDDISEERIIKEYILEKNEFRDYFENLKTLKPISETVFIQNVENYSNNLEIEHLDNFLHKDWLLKFGRSLGYQKIIFKPKVIGQSICIMKKPISE